MPGREPPERFPVRFYLVAMIFIVFDIEIIFLYPWAVIYRELGAVRAVARSLIFAVAVFVSFVYLIGNGALDWGPAKRPRRLVADGRRPSAPATTTIRRVGLEGREPRPSRRGGVPDAVGIDSSKGLEGLDHNFLTGTLEDLVKWAAPQVDVAGHVRPGLLRHRDDGDRRRRTTTSPASAWRSSGPRPARPTS